MRRAKNIETRKLAAAEEKSKLLKNIERTEPLFLHPLPLRREPFITLRDVSPSYGERNIGKGINLVINPGDRIALCGGNGSGKTGLFKLICGMPLSFSGEIRRAGHLVISYLPQEVSHISGSVADFARAHRLDDPLFRAILRKLDFSRAQFELDMRYFSEGQKKKVLLAKKSFGTSPSLCLGMSRSTMSTSFPVSKLKNFCSTPAAQFCLQTRCRVC
jgi:lincosamide and streptogramin A transport system ATP-binding/permease protein